MKRPWLLLALLSLNLPLTAQTGPKNSSHYLFLKAGGGVWKTSVGCEFYLKPTQSLHVSYSWGRLDGYRIINFSNDYYENYQEKLLHVGYRFYKIHKKGIARLFVEPGYCQVAQTGYVKDTGWGSSHFEIFNEDLYGIYANAGLQMRWKFISIETSMGLGKMLNERRNEMYGRLWGWVNVSLGVGIPLHIR